ncbi:hypothetical protein KC327_g9690 [Hortaea werneckii]|uniref:N-acetyltransferase domain-containing protein n=2 Tax=Hortaea werneckii TaxID=91943 RepID=A0A3M7IQN4_HORWE|nr:hypothetical protein KC358_g9974 [Hortaea werneckii]OTA33941.1 hypothetical protein BTJ68_07524 [Hortaea werneckii EXF-2000]KAI6831137.1 hypothetical protein KC350_g7417 [Hortaea werneckii]KAI6921296.1 hypothetical protein KC348_g10193 [Hortaea werneckii]KAI6931286.1 hypothetical protein KC341_g9690 [Hortaea werneckii]
MSTSHPFTISPAKTQEDLNAIVQLFKAYALALGIDLTFQDFASEVATLPAKYASPTGCLLLARDSAGRGVGCVGLRPLRDEEDDGGGDDDGVAAGVSCCEMKRLYVDPSQRGSGLGRLLAERVVCEARRMGYRRMRLDTLPSMLSARARYKAVGFREIEPYYRTPIDGTIFMELEL